jgi:type VI secretion system Hcp family effector
MATTTTETEIVSPRDAASGLPIGKRQHRPVTITKTLDKSSPELMGVADLDSDGRLDVVVAFKWSDGSTMGLDDWEAPVN